MTKTQSLSALCVFALAMQAWARETPGAEPSSGPGSNAPAAAGGHLASNASAAITSEDLKQLRERIAKQEEEIKQLQQRD